MLDENTNIYVTREDFYQLQMYAPYDNDGADRLPDSARCQYPGWEISRHKVSFWGIIVNNGTKRAIFQHCNLSF